MQETSWSSKLTFSRERWSGIAPCYVRRVESAVQESRQTVVFGVDAQENPGGPLRPDLSLSLLPGPLPHDLCRGQDSPCWLPAVGWYHWLSGYEFEQTLGDSEGQGSLACCSPSGHKELNITEWLNNKLPTFPGAGYYHMQVWLYVIRLMVSTICFLTG